MKTNLYYLLGALLLISAATSAQNRFSVSVTGGPVINYASARYNILLPGSSPGQGSQTIITTVDNQSTRGGYSIGLSANYAFTPNWSISTGFWYNRLSMNGTNPFNATPTPTRIIGQDYQVPLLVNYRLGHKRLSPYFSAGALANFPRSTIYREEGNSGDSFKLLFSTSMDVRAVVGAGVAYQLNNHLSLIAQPMLIWRFKPAGDYERYVAYQVNGQIQLMYSF
jgi:hypothetical protein